MIPRIREIIDPFGIRLRISIEQGDAGLQIALERPGRAACPRILLDAYGAELLSGYIMAARLTVPQDLAGELAEGCFPLDLRLSRQPSVAIEVRQRGTDGVLDIPTPLWDKLYAELCLAIPHVRELSWRAGTLVH